MNAIGLAGVTAGYYVDTPVLEDLSMVVKEGSVATALGPNGSGKSTLLSVILGYLTPTAGEVSVFGRPLLEQSRQDLGRQLAFVSPSTYLPFNYSVFDYLLLGTAAQLSFWGQPGERERAAAESALEEAGIAHLRHRNVQELSSGELQMASIGRGLTQNPRVLLLDEPTSHLDPANALEVFTLIRELKRAGRTVLFTTHDPLHARQVADEALLLREGRLIAAAPAAEALVPERLSELYGVSFLEAAYGSRRIPFLDL